MGIVAQIPCRSDSSIIATDPTAMAAFGLVHADLMNALASEFSTAYSDLSHSEWNAAFLSQQSGVTSRLKVEVKLPDGDVTWVNAGDAGNWEATGQQAWVGSNS